MERMPFGDAAFDTVLAFDVLEHCEDDVAALAEVRRVLRLEGHFVVSVPLHTRYWSELDRVVVHTFRYDPSVLLRRLDVQGFVPLKAVIYRPLHPQLKRIGDRLILACLHHLGTRRATAAKAHLMRWLPSWMKRARFAPFTGVVPPDANAITLVCRRER